MKYDQVKLVYDARIYDAASRTAIARIVAQSGERRLAWDIPLSKLTEPKAVYKELLDAGVPLPISDRCPDEVVRVCHAQPRCILRRLSRLGLVSDKRAFACADGVVGPDAKGLLPPKIDAPRHKAMFASRGCFQGWIDEVAKPLRFSTPGIVCLSAAAAAPALSLVGNISSFGINLYGRSKAGKSALAAATNGFGGTGIAKYLLSLSASHAALTEVARLHNDRAAVFDETGAVPGGAKKKRDTFASLTYELASGQDYARHSASVFEPAASNFATIFFFTSEYDMDSIALAAGATRDEGERARLFDLLGYCAETGTIFDRRPKNVAPAEWKKWAAKRVIDLYGASERHHGVALPVLAEYLCKHSDACRRMIEANAGKFEQRFLHDDMDSVDRHRLRNLAFVYGGATVAIRAGVLPFEPKLVWDALKTLVPNAKPRIDRFAEVRAIVRNAARKLPRASAVKTRGSDALIGYRGDIDGVSRYVFRAADFRDLFGGDAVQYRHAILWLGSTDRLEARGARSNAASARIEERTVKWPDGTSVRSIVFRGHPRAAHGSRRSK